MANMHEITKLITELNTCIQNAFAENDICSRDNNAITPFLRIANLLITRFTEETDQADKQRHFAALWSYAYIHYKNIFSQLKSYNTISSYSRRYVGLGNWIEKFYLPSLGDFLNKGQNAFDECANILLFQKCDEGSESEALVNVKGENEALTYQMGPLMAEIKASKPSTLLQAELQAAVTVYFEKIKDLAETRIQNATWYTGSALLLSAIGGPPTILATCAISAVVRPMLTREAEYTQRTLQRVEFEASRHDWKSEMEQCLDAKNTDTFLQLPLGYEPRNQAEESCRALVLSKRTMATQ